ncbi:hypothetical protein IPJ91_02490 [bacterium]|nr:MAG: hypothetical protein IPJ91_02490 [bacterium]
MSYKILANQDPFSEKKVKAKEKFDNYPDSKSNELNISNFTLSSKFQGPGWMKKIGVWLASQKFWPKYFELKIMQYFEGVANMDQIVALFEGLVFEGKVDIGGETKTILEHYLDFAKVVDPEEYILFQNFLHTIYSEFKIVGFDSANIVFLENIKTKSVFSVDKSDRIFLKRGAILLARIYKDGYIWKFTEGFVAARFEKLEAGQKLLRGQSFKKYSPQLDSLYLFYRFQNTLDKIEVIQSLEYDELLVVFFHKCRELLIRLNLFDFELEILEEKSIEKFIENLELKLNFELLSAEDIVFLKFLAKSLFVSHPAKQSFLNTESFTKDFINKVLRISEYMNDGDESNLLNYSSVPNKVSTFEVVEEFERINEKFQSVYRCYDNFEQYLATFQKLLPIYELTSVNVNLRERNRNSLYYKKSLNRLYRLLEKKHFEDIRKFLLGNVNIKNNSKNATHLRADKMSDMILTKVLIVTKFEDNEEGRFQNGIVTKLLHTLESVVNFDIGKPSSKQNSQMLELLRLASLAKVSNNQCQLSTFGKQALYRRFSESELFESLMKSVFFELGYKYGIEKLFNFLTDPINTQIKNMSKKDLGILLMLRFVDKDLDDNLISGKFGNIMIESIKRNVHVVFPSSLVHTIISGKL